MRVGCLRRGSRMVCLPGAMLLKLTLEDDMSEGILLQTKNLHVEYGGVKALDGVDVAVDEGEIVAVLGPNGAGKSTVLKSFFGLTPVTTGEFFWHGVPFTPLSPEVVKRGISFVPQGRRVFTRLSVKENLEMGGISVKDKTLLKENLSSVLDLFPDLKLKLKKPAGTLSGGQQQMVALARGLMTDPKVLLLDEPSLGLSPKLVKEVFHRIRDINQKRKIAVVVVEHNLKSLFEITDRVYVLAQGKVAREGPA